MADMPFLLPDVGGAPDDWFFPVLGDLQIEAFLPPDGFEPPLVFEPPPFVFEPPPFVFEPPPLVEASAFFESPALHPFDPDVPGAPPPELAADPAAWFAPEPRPDAEEATLLAGVLRRLLPRRADATAEAPAADAAAAGASLETAQIERAFARLERLGEAVQVVRKVAVPVVGIVRDVRERRRADAHEDEPATAATPADRTADEPGDDAVRGAG